MKAYSGLAGGEQFSNSSPHRLRATFATGVWESGASIAQITSWMGHEDPQTTMGYIMKRTQGGEAVQKRFAQTLGWVVANPATAEGNPPWIRV
ncbi:MAG: site-specific integrase [Bacteroidetes bacterium]|nr:site-specific integrase [Bacteroidota bacterium]